MSKFGLAPKLPAKEPHESLKAEILWGCESGGSPRFPSDVGTIHARRHSLEPKPMDAFRKAVSSAMARVWIVDEYFLVPDNAKSSDGRIFTILDWLHPDLVASDIRILTKKDDAITGEALQLFQMREEEINSKRTRQPMKCSIQISTRLTQNFDYIHDRFAIVDDELWHFGATVGGFHASVNAASRGWSAIESGAIAFFELVWEKCKE